jgi:hypothetical protein
MKERSCFTGVLQIQHKDGSFYILGITDGEITIDDAKPDEQKIELLNSQGQIQLQTTLTEHGARRFHELIEAERARRRAAGLPDYDD